MITILPNTSCDAVNTYFPSELDKVSSRFARSALLRELTNEISGQRCLKDNNFFNDKDCLKYVLLKNKQKTKKLTKIKRKLT